MSTSQPDNPQQNPQPHYSLSETTSFDTILYAFDGPGDTTIRPARPELHEHLNAMRKLLGLPPPKEEGPEAAG